MMRLENKTREILAEAKELMDVCVKNVNIHSIKHMSVVEFETLQRCIKLVDSACELSIEQASMIDEMNDKLDKVLKILEKNES